MQKKMQKDFQSIMEQELKNHLISYCRGPRRGISAAQLAANFKTTERQIRALIRHMRVDRKVPICGTPGDSFFWPENAEQTKQTLRSLKSRKEALEELIDSLTDAINKQFGAPRLF